MATYLAKTEPEEYSIDDLARDKRTVWDGVRNPQAVNAIRAMQPGDRVFVYHTGSERAIVGLAKVVSVPRPDRKDHKSWEVDVAFVRKFAQSVTLAAIKATRRFDDWALVRQGRLSVMPAPKEFLIWLGQKGFRV